MKRERIIRVLLNENNLTKYRVSKLAETSFSWTHEFLKQLEKKNLIKGTKVINKSKLIKYWETIHKKPEYKQYFIQKPLKLLKETKLKYALTTHQAENLTQKYLFPSRTDFYIKKEDINKWHKLLTKNGLYGKGNVRILITDEHIFYKSKTIKGLKVVNFPQLILDLLVEGGPATEAGELLLKKNV